MDPDPETGSRLYLFVIAIVLLFAASALFALMETAFASVSRTKIKVRSDRGDGRAKNVLYILDHFDRSVTTLLIVINIAHIAAASLATVFVTRLFHSDSSLLAASVTISTFVTTILMFFLGELLPKSIGKKTAERSCLALSGLLRVLMFVLYPFSSLLALLGSAVSKMTKSDEEATVTEDELYDIIEDMQEEGELSEEQGDLISSALQFGDVTVSSILTPRVDLAGLDIQTPPEEALQFIREQNHSRILVYEKSIDNVIGVLQIRKFLKSYIKNHRIPNLRRLLDKVYYARQSMGIDELLSEMTARKLNMAVVLDSYGGTLGVVTVEDILEEIVGEIWDEDDVIKEPLVKLSENVFMVSGDETVLDAFDFIGFEDPEEKENEERFTNLLVSDWVFEQFSHIPKKGDAFNYHEVAVSVAEIRHNRILKVKMELLSPLDEEEKEAGHDA